MSHVIKPMCKKLHIVLTRQAAKHLPAHSRIKHCQDAISKGGALQFAFLALSNLESALWPGVEGLELHMHCRVW